MRVRLYTTSACHLCERAERLLRAEGAAWGVRPEMVDIVERDDLFEHYAWRIPVLQCVASGAELDWPFDRSDLRRWLHAMRQNSSA